MKAASARLVARAIDGTCFIDSMIGSPRRNKPVMHVVTPERANFDFWWLAIELATICLELLKCE